MTDPDPTTVPERLADAPPSAKLVHAVLRDAERPLSTSEIAECAHLAPGQVRRATSLLAEREAVMSRPALGTRGERWSVDAVDE